jgi:hypothetical protein
VRRLDLVVDAVGAAVNLYRESVHLHRRGDLPHHQVESDPLHRVLVVRDLGRDVKRVGDAVKIAVGLADDAGVAVEPRTRLKPPSQSRATSPR